MRYQVIGVDTFDGDEWIEGDFITFEEAIACAKEKGGVMTKMHVYDDTGRRVFQAGTF